MDGIIAGHLSMVEVISAEKIAMEKQEVTVVVKVGLGCSSIKVILSKACNEASRSYSAKHAKVFAKWRASTAALSTAALSAAEEFAAAARLDKWRRCSWWCKQ